MAPQLSLQEPELKKFMECTLIKFAGDAKVEGPLDNSHSEGCRRLGKRASRNLLKFSKDKYQIFHLRRKGLLQCYRLGFLSSTAEKDLERRWQMESWASACNVPRQQRPRTSRLALGDPGKSLSSALYLSDHFWRPVTRFGCKKDVDQLFCRHGIAQLFDKNVSLSFSNICCAGR